MKVAINGAGIAGTALAYWLSKLGHEVLLVERAPELRSGGFVVNLWGIGYDALERMGPVSYTHLDVYKRQPDVIASSSACEMAQTNSQAAAWKGRLRNGRCSRAPSTANTPANSSEWLAPRWPSAWS